MRQNPRVFGIRGTELLFEAMWLEGDGWSRILAAKCCPGGDVAVWATLDVLTRAGQSPQLSQNGASACSRQAHSESPTCKLHTPVCSWWHTQARTCFLSLGTPPTAAHSEAWPLVRGMTVCTVSDIWCEGEKTVQGKAARITERSISRFRTPSSGSTDGSDLRWVLVACACMWEPGRARLLSTLLM